MEFPQVVNATPHALHVYDESGERIVQVLPHEKSDPIARVGGRAVRLSNAVVAGVEIAVYGTAYGQVSGLPEPQEGVWYVVALPVALAAPDRTDLLVCGPDVRDENNRMIGCMGLSVPHHPAAAHPEPRRFRSKEDLGKLYEQGPEDFPWDFYTPYGLARLLFARGLISKEEIDLAERDFGERWMRHSKTRLDLDQAIGRSDG